MSVLEIRWKTAHFCILHFSFYSNHFVWEVILIIRQGVSKTQGRDLGLSFFPIRHSVSSLEALLHDYFKFQVFKFQVY